MSFKHIGVSSNFAKNNHISSPFRWYGTHVGCFLVNHQPADDRLPTTISSSSSRTCSGDGARQLRHSKLQGTCRKSRWSPIGCGPTWLDVWENHGKIHGTTIRKSWNHSLADFPAKELSLPEGMQVSSPACPYDFTISLQYHHMFAAI